MEKTSFRGIVHGRNIELDEAPHLPEGESVIVEIRPLYVVGEGIRRSAGSWADAGDALTEWLEHVYQARRTRRSSNGT